MMNSYTRSSIVIADDDVEDLQMIQNAILEVAPGTPIIAFPNGRLVQQYLEQAAISAPPGLVVLDYNMPEMTGAEVLLYMKTLENLQGTPRVVLSTSSSRVYITECLANGADEYLVKPDSWNELLALARKLVNLSTLKNA